MTFRRHGLLCICLVLAAMLVWLHMRRTGPPSSVAVTMAEQSRSQPEAPVFTETEPLLPVAKKPEPPKPAALPDDFLKSILSVDEKSVLIPLPGGGSVEGRVESLRRDENGLLLVQGNVISPEPGRFMFSRQTVPGKEGPLVGFIHYDKSDAAWRISPTGPNGNPALVKTDVHEVICRAYAAPEQADAPEEIPPTHPTNYPIPPDENGIIQLQSLPGASAVIYLDYDGEERNFASWGYINALPFAASNAQIFEVWKGVCEDFQPFNVNVTTVRSVFDAAPANRRIQVVVTPTTTAAPGAGGVAYVGSFNWTSSVVCWSFFGIGKNAVEVISHEVGHTLGLSHDGRTAPAEVYYNGHSGWAPIMGTGYYQNPSQWSKGEYPSANNTEDDLAIIAANINTTGYRADDHAASSATATYLDITSAGAVSNEGVIETTADEDSFRFTTTGGAVTLNINGVSFNPNLDIKAEILDGANTVIATNDPTGSMNASFNSLVLTAGDYLLRISGTGRGDLVTGYSDYASLGAYTVTGTVSGGVAADRFTIAENSANGSSVGTVAARTSHGAGTLVFAISSGNTGGTFAIDSATGAITVANGSLLDFEALSTRWDDPANFELFVSITDSLGIASESIRTVVTISDVNESPVFPIPAAITIAENLTAGTQVTRVQASDPDRSDHVTFSIVAGNSGGAFAINSATGIITVAGALDFETNPAYTLTLRATDHLSPALTADAALSISLMDLPEHLTPGTIVRTFFNGIEGFTVGSLTTSANYPNRPHSETVLGSFDSGTAKGDSYGSTLRGYLIAPATGNYTFSISADDAAELRISPDADPLNAVTRASVSFATNPYDWTTYPGQTSSAVSLTAGQVCYIEARHKAGYDGDHVQVAWQGPGIPAREVIPGRWLVPYLQNYAPWAANQFFTVRESADNDQRIGQLAFVEPDTGQSLSGYTITAGNSGGLFSVNFFSGDITVANGAALTPGSVHFLTISTTDNGSPATAGSAIATIQVLGLHEQLHAWWKLDETSGAFASDSSGNARDAGLTSGGSWITRAAANNALQLNGTSTRLDYMGNNSLSGATPFSVAAWVKVPVTHAADGMIIQQREAGSTGYLGTYRVVVKTNGRINFNLYGRDANGANEAFQFDITTPSGVTVNDGTWHHVACVRDGTSGRIYIDGVLRASGSGAIRMLDPVLTVAIGGDARDNNTFLNAAVDDVRIYADALGSQQLTRIAGTPKTAITSPLAETASIPSGVGILLQSAASDPNGTTPASAWTMVGGPGSVTFETPSAASTAAVFSTPGIYQLRHTASDGTNSASADVIVTYGATPGPVNLGPHVSAGPDLNISTALPFTLAGVVSDDGQPSGVTTTWSLVSGPGSIVFADANLPATTATCAAAGTHVLRLTADDGAVKTFDDTTVSSTLLNTIGVAASDANAAETGPDSGTFTFTRGGSLIGDLAVNFTLSGSATNGTDYVSISNNIVIPGGVTTATVTLTPLADALVEGVENVVLTIDTGGYDITSGNATINIADSNHAPVWQAASITGVAVIEGGAYAGPSLAASASDPDGNALTFSKTGGPGWLDVASDGTLSGTPAAPDVGANAFDVRVTDVHGLSADAVLHIQVAFANLPPQILTAPVTTANAVARIPYAGSSLASHATDPNLPQGDVLVFSKLSGPAWLDIASDGTLSGTPPPENLGLNLFDARVTDAAGASADIVLHITVVETILYLDANGSTAGSGSPSFITWDDSAIWSTDPGGAATTHPWPAGASAVLTAAGDPAPALLTVDGTRLLAGLHMNGGDAMITGGMLELTGSSTPFSITGSADLSATLTGVGLLKNGPGTLKLSAANTFSGGTIVADGTLMLTGSLASGISIHNGAVLTGGGSVTGAATVSGTLAPGAQVGQLATGPLVMETGARIEWQASDWTAAAGTGYDTLNAASLDLTSAAAVTLALQAQSLTNFTGTATTFTLVHTTSGITGYSAANFTIDDTAFPGTEGDWTLRQYGVDLLLDYVPSDPFAAWQLAMFGASSGNPLIAGETADPDGDGLPNLIEFALGTNPNAASTTKILMDLLEIEGIRYLRLTIPKNPAATDITYTVQTSGDPSDPQSWSAATTFIEENTPTQLIVRDTQTGPPRFIRLRVTR
jgi:autotransporter-associated beta strand protein